MGAVPELEAESQLAGYLRTLRRRKWTIVLVTLVGAGAAVGFAKAERPVYQASAQVLLQPTPVQEALGGGTGPVATPVNVEDEILRLESAPVKALVRKQLGSAPRVRGSNPAGTDIMDVTAESSSPARAAAVANAYAHAYLQDRRTALVNGLVAAVQLLEGRISALQAEVSSLEDELSRASTSQHAALAATLTPQITALSQQEAALAQQVSDLQLAESVGSGGAQLLAPASPPSAPVSPNPGRDGLIGLVGGLVVGTGLAFVREHLDDTLATREDLERAQPGLPVLGVIPAVPGQKKRSRPEVVASSRPHSAPAEAYRSLRTSVQFLGLDRPVKLLQVTSPGSGEGKTTTLANLAVCLAQAGNQVGIVCCDLRRPRVHELFGLDNAVGLTTVLRGEVPLSRAVQRVPGEEGLVVLASGERPPNPAELLASERTAETLAAFAAKLDVVLVDSPPVLPVTDAVVVATRVDATVVVVSARSSSRRDLARALEVLGQVDAPVVGTVLNAVEAGDRYGYRYGYVYGYGREGGQERSARSMGGVARAGGR